MAAIFTTSCAGYTSLSAAAPGPFAAVNGTPTVNVGGGPNGINSVTFALNAYVQPPNISFGSGSGIAVGFGLTVAPGGSGTVALFGSPGQDALVVNVDGSIGFYPWDGTAVVSASGAFSFGTRHTVEWSESNISTYPSTVKVYVDGALVATGTTTTGAFWGFPQTQLRFGNVACTIDSIYVCDLSGSINNGVLSQIYGHTGQSVPYVPSRTGSQNAWTASDSGTLYHAVASIPPSGDALYASDATPSDQMSVGVNNTSIGLATVAFVTVQANVRQTGAGRTIGVGIGNGGLPVYAAPVGLPCTYVGIATTFNTNPVTNAPWVTSDLTTLELALEVAS